MTTPQETRPWVVHRYVRLSQDQVVVLVHAPDQSCWMATLHRDGEFVLTPPTDSKVTTDQEVAIYRAISIHAINAYFGFVSL